MIWKLLILVLGLASMVSASPRRFRFHADLTVGDLYEQGFYPGPGGSRTVAFFSGGLVVSVGDQEDVFEFPECLAGFTCKPNGEVRHAGLMSTGDPIPLNEAIKWIDSAANRLGVETRSNKPHPMEPASESGVKWTKMGAKYRLPDSSWSISFFVQRSGEVANIHVSFVRPNDRKERIENMRAWKGIDSLHEPEKWSHLPLPGPYRGRTTEVRDFMSRVSSYDDEGNLLPQFVKRREELEGDQWKKEPKLRRPRGTPTKIEPAETVPSAQVSPWVWIAGSLLLASLAYWWYQRRDVRG